MHLPPDCIFAFPQEGRELGTGLRLGCGWHPQAEGPEGAPGPAWTRSPRATLQVSAGHFPEPVPLRLTLRAFAASRAHPVTLRLSSPGHPPLTRVLTGPVTLRLPSPRHAPGAQASAITFELGAFGCPLLLGGAADPRQLGLALVAVSPRWPLRARLRRLLASARRRLRG